LTSVTALLYLNMKPILKTILILSILFNGLACKESEVNPLDCGVWEETKKPYKVHIKSSNYVNESDFRKTGMNITIMYDQQGKIIGLLDSMYMNYLAINKDDSLFLLNYVGGKDTLGIGHDYNGLSWESFQDYQVSYAPYDENSSYSYPKIHTLKSSDNTLLLDFSIPTLYEIKYSNQDLSFTQEEKISSSPIKDKLGIIPFIHRYTYDSPFAVSSLLSSSKLADLCFYFNTLSPVQEVNLGLPYRNSITSTNQINPLVLEYSYKMEDTFIKEVEIKASSDTSTYSISYQIEVETWD
jgi:hypothetical protein